VQAAMRRRHGLQLVVLVVSVVVCACRAGQDERPSLPTTEPASPPELPAERAAAAAARDAGAEGRDPADGGDSLLSIHFDDTAPGTVPEGFVIAETAGAGTPATWEVVDVPTAPSTPRAFGTTASENYGHTFNIALVEGSSYRDVDLSVAVHCVAGEEDQGGGPVWRARDSDNYYIARWNPLEHNFRVYHVRDGRRRQLASAQVRLDGSAWHTIRIVMRGAHIEASLDGERLLEVDDTTFGEAGMVGLWVKADGQTLFDDLVVRSVQVEGTR